MPPQTQQQALKDVINKGVQAVNTAVDVAANTADPVQAARDSLDVGRTILNAHQNIAELDQKVRKLEGSSPGTLKLIQETAAAMDSLGELALPTAKQIPGVDPAMLNDMRNTSKSFTEFAEAYAAYEKATKDWVPLNEVWTGNTAKKEWNEFKQNFDALEKHVPPALKTASKSGVVNDAANAAIDAAEQVLDLFK